MVFDPRIKNDAAMQREKESRVVAAFGLVETVLREAIGSYRMFHSAHEGFAVVLEEVDELRELLRYKTNASRLHGNPVRDKMRTEAAQVAAMAIRFIVDCC